jgi:phosphate transport system permease protein
VVLGFIGISVVGDLIKSTSQVEWLQWIPGFPVQERLNMFNAGCLLALMAIPTMFSLAEDAINNVPRAFSEASEALGATKLQTVFRVIVPASMSGILAAMLLGLGRIIGETMVVLLVAGNRIAIPDFSDGIGTVFQPAHTLTGIIAQELGEVSRGSSHWQALFMVGILLFAISLFINWAARLLVRKFQLPKI